MEKSKLWRLRLNWFIVLFLGQILFKVNATAYLASFHRFVTNPGRKHLKGTHSLVEIEPGLEESEFFYSLLLSLFYASACIGTLLNGFLVMCIPYWYLFVVAICSHILGYTIYGVASHGWHLIFAQIMNGYFNGAQVTLSFIYASDSSLVYAELVRLRDGAQNVDEKYGLYIRDLLYTLITVGNVVGYYVGPGIAVAFSYTMIDHFHSIAWLNVAYGVLLLVLVVFLFRGEIRCTNSNRQCEITFTKPTCLELFILGSMFLLSLIDMFKMGFYETLMSPVLTDSFGLSLKVVSYFYLVLGIPRLLGSLLLFLLQKLRFTNNLLLVIGIILTMAGYAFLTDWQTIPYDPCTEYSPFHHPELIAKFPSMFKSVPKNTRRITNNSMPHDSVRITSKVALTFNDNSTIIYTGSSIVMTCTLAPHCPCDLSDRISCYKFSAIGDNNIPLQYTCSLFDHPPCSTIHRTSDSIIDEDSTSQYNQVEVQDIRLVLTDAEYYFASNSCMNARVPGQQCHWIPFSIITHKKCDDCPPICRAEKKTMSFVQFTVGMALLVLAFPVITVPLMSLVTNLAPSINNSKGVVIGFVAMSSFLSQALSPLILDSIYEGVHKRTFLVTIILGAVHIPFLIEILVLYKQMGYAMSNHSKQDKGDSKSNRTNLN